MSTLICIGICQSRRVREYGQGDTIAAVGSKSLVEPPPVVFFRFQSSVVRFVGRTRVVEIFWGLKDLVDCVLQQYRQLPHFWFKQTELTLVASSHQNVEILGKDARKE